MDSPEFCFLLRDRLFSFSLTQPQGIGGNYVTLCHDFGYDSLS